MVLDEMNSSFIKVQGVEMKIHETLEMELTELNAVALLGDAKAAGRLDSMGGLPSNPSFETLM